MPFILDDRLAKDTIHLRELPLCRFLLMNDRRYPWLILVPRHNGLSEIHDLRDKDQSTLIFEVTAATRALEKLFQPKNLMSLRLEIWFRNSIFMSLPGSRRMKHGSIQSGVLAKT